MPTVTKYDSWLQLQQLTNMERKLYVLVILLILGSCHSEKIRNKSFDITIDDAQSYKYDLVNGVYTVHFMDRPDTTIRFHLSADEASKIVDMYYNLEIDNINGVDRDWGTIYIEDNCRIMPKPYTILHVKAKTTQQDIQIDEGCDDFTFGNKRRGKSVKHFLDFIRMILQSKPEIKGAPQSNVIYM
jgi:hypothetical protein